MSIRNRSVFLGATIFLVSACFVVAAFAAEGNVRKGRMLFAQNCRACHSESGEGCDLGPVSRTQAEWEAAFEKEKYIAYPCADKWKKLSPQDIIDILSYFKDGASDGVLPVGCG